MKTRFFVAAGIGFLVCTLMYFAPVLFEPSEAELYWDHVSQTNSAAFTSLSIDFAIKHGFILTDITNPDSRLWISPTEKQAWFQAASQARDYAVASQVAETNYLRLVLPRKAWLARATWFNSQSLYLFNLSFLALITGLIWPARKTV